MNKSEKIIFIKKAILYGLLSGVVCTCFIFVYEVFALRTVFQWELLSYLFWQDIFSRALGAFVVLFTVDTLTTFGKKYPWYKIGLLYGVFLWISGAASSQFTDFLVRNNFGYPSGSIEGTLLRFFIFDILLGLLCALVLKTATRRS